jgi:glycosyltransferase involved in cell wall biosynthesis
MVIERRIAIILRFGLNPRQWTQRHARGEVVDETPYAYHLAEQWFSVAWSQDRVETRVARWWRLSVRHFLGFDFVHVWRNRRIIQQADAVWTHTEREHLAVALLKALAPRRYQAVSIAQSVWLWDLWPHLSRLRSTFFRSLLRRHAVEVVLSRVNHDASLEAVPGRTVVRVPFGTHFAAPAAPDALPPSPPRVLVVGNDRHRDWGLLAEVTTLLPEVDFDVISLSEDARARPWPMNVELRSVPQSQVLAAYGESTLVALPLRENRHASGCTVAIEAISARIPLIVSDAGGIDEYVTGTDADLVPIGDARAFADAIRRRLTTLPADHANWSTASERGLSERDYISRLALLTFAALEDRPLPSAVETFAPVPDPLALREGVTA